MSEEGTGRSSDGDARPLAPSRAHAIAHMCGVHLQKGLPYICDTPGVEAVEGYRRFLVPREFYTRPDGEPLRCPQCGDKIWVASFSTTQWN